MCKSIRYVKYNKVTNNLKMSRLEADQVDTIYFAIDKK